MFYPIVLSQYYLNCASAFMPGTHRRRRRDATVELSGVGGAYWALVIGLTERRVRPILSRSTTNGTPRCVR